MHVPACGSVTTLGRASSFRIRRRWGLRCLSLAAVLAALGLVSPRLATAVSLSEAKDLFRTGKYEECASAVSDELLKGAWGDTWPRLLIRAELAQGKYKAAIASYEEAKRRFPTSGALKLLGQEVYKVNGRTREAMEAMEELDELIQLAPNRFSTAEGHLILGRFFLDQGADAKRVLDQFFDVVTRQAPEEAEGFYATAELALAKQDNGLAAQTLQKAPEDAEKDPYYHYLLARAFENDDRPRSKQALDAALKINPRHVDSLLLKADQLIDDEAYDEAEKTLKQVFEINIEEPRAWAYQAALAHLRNDPSGEASARESGLSRWKTNPEVDHIIGRELSKKYRFAEGASYQRKALELDPKNLGIKLQLCQDLLRLGEEEEGWKLADEVFAKDGYNVVAFNLTNLRDRLAGFRTFEQDGFVVRMEAREADLYGSRVLDLLRRAKKTLGERYEVDLKEPVIVEIFPQRKEFAVRTFGLPGAEGLLGVCFGRVVTANSPASQGESPANWEAVLWHEFCHVITLTKTRNKMPRWLSEGISVHEEEREDPSWGDKMNPRFREMILDDTALTPLSQLSSAFLAPKTALHLQFAYFESALAVAFMEERFGHDALNGILDDLGTGLTINESLPGRLKMSLDQLDRDFSAFAKDRARKVAPDLTWEEPKLPADADSSTLSKWLEQHPRSFWGLKRLAARLVSEKEWKKAKEVLIDLKKQYPDYVGPENAYMLLATVHRETKDPKAEREVLEELTKRSSDASAGYLRLLEMEEESKDWASLARDAQRMLAINPLIPAPHRQLARAAEQLGRRADAITAYRAFAQLDGTDPAENHYRLARLLKEEGRSDEARREVLQALEEAPRFLEAHQLLLELPSSSKPPESKAVR